MKMTRSSRRNASAAGILALAATAAATAADTPTYTCTYLKELSGRSVPFLGAINENNAIAAIAAQDDWRGRRAMVWKKQQPLALASWGDVESAAYGINDKGVIVGFIQESQFKRPVTWTANTPAQLPVLTETAPGGTAYRINAKGHVVGWSYDEGYKDRAVFWRNGKVTDLGGLTSDRSLESYAYGLNDVGTIVGASRFQVGLISRKAVRWDGTPKRISPLNGLTERGDASGKAINNAGVIVGYSNYEGGASWEHHAVAWTSIDPIDLGTLPGGTSSDALDVNSVGTIVGSSVLESGDSSATVWYGLQAAPADLNSLVAGPGCVDAAGQAYTLISANAINDKGVIAAWAQYIKPDGKPDYGAFRLTPR